MASGDVQVQGAVHSLEQGKLAQIIKAGMVTVIVIALFLLYLFVHFKGLDTASAMDQAQIARNIAAGEGFTTKNISPLALETLREAGKIGVDGAPMDVAGLPDIYQSPLYPYLLSVPLGFIKDTWEMDLKDVVYAGDRMLAFVAMVWLLVAVAVWFFVVAKLFDKQLAFYVACIVLVTDLLWQFSLSGLPQMMLMALFGGVILMTLYAEEAQERERFLQCVLFLVGCGALLGLMVLTHGLMVWLMLGWLLYAGIVFRPRGLMWLVAFAAALVFVVPWLMRNWAVCGNPLGLAFLQAFHADPAHIGYLRSTDPGGGLDLKGVFRRGITSQLGNLPAYFGLNIAAMAFFVAVLHRFRNETTASMRWGLVAMWLALTVGMCFYKPEGDISPNQLHVIFLPIFAAYGFAFLLVLWNRWEFGQGLLRIIFIVGVIVLCGAPLLMTLFAGPSGRVQWPPYVPPFISVLGQWFEEDEIITADMPWAVAWYANRHALLLPQSVRDFNRMHDYQETKQPIRGLYLTPVSGNQPLYGQIYKGRFAQWAPLITRPPQVRGFPFAFFQALPIEGECIIFSDRARWNERRPSE